MKFNIENYENMTPEEKIAALEAYEPDMSGYVAKATFDKTASELAGVKKQLRESLSADEAKKQQEADEKAALLARVEELERERSVSTYATSYMGMGYSEKLAKATAEALVKGDMDTVFKNQKIHIDEREKELRTELLKKTPTPPAGDVGAGKTKADLAKMTLDEKQKFFTEHPDAYREIYNK